MRTFWTRFGVLAAVAFYLGATPAQADPITLFNTGVAGDGTLLAAGATDPHYTITSVNGQPTSNPSVVHTPGVFPLDGSGTWVPNTATAQWINPVNPSGSPTPYTYHTSFNLPSNLDPATASISGTWSMDDTGGISLNGGSPVGVVGGYGGNNATNFQLLGGFHTGLNTLDFNVNDTNGAPTGLMVQLNGTASPVNNNVPEPSTLAVFGLATLAAARYRRRSR